MALPQLRRTKENSSQTLQPAVTCFSVNYEITFYCLRFDNNVKASIFEILLCCVYQSCGLVGEGDFDLSVETAGSEQSRVQSVRTVCRHDHFDLKLNQLLYSQI
jgi:hypothetical protein